MTSTRISRLVLQSLIILSYTAGSFACTVKTDTVRLGDSITVNLPGSTFSQCKGNGGRVIECEKGSFSGEARWTDHIRGSCDRIVFFDITDSFYMQIICDDLHDPKNCVDIRLKKHADSDTKPDSIKEPSTPPTPTTTVYPTTTRTTTRTTTIDSTKGPGDSSRVQLTIGVVVGVLVIGVLIVGAFILHKQGKLSFPCWDQGGPDPANGKHARFQRVQKNDLNGTSHVESVSLQRNDCEIDVDGKPLSVDTEPATP
ncbi:uncharacterized protein LOC134461467 [Engraulis encrasicolus]|uniref:uncharacterized protein LOC134461467 n=1 Tax=Engraulis encrasicolus TaxID=184585 RepID=UPI002FD14202